MRVTRFGFQAGVFYLVMVAAFYAAPYSNLFFLLLSFLTILGAGGLLGARRNLRGVQAALPALAPVPAQLELDLPVSVVGPRSPRFQIDVHLELVGGQRIGGHLDCLDVQATPSLRSPGLARGVYRIQGLALESVHPFGLLRGIRKFAAPKELIVYPTPGDLLEGRSASDALDELLGRADPSAGDLQPSGLRDHREGDDVRGIHWRASARRGSLVVREWEGGRGQGLEILLDRRASAEDLEEALSTISALVHLARTGKETLRLHSQGLAATFGEGQRPWIEALEFLARAEPLPLDGAAPPSVSPSVARLPQARSHSRDNTSEKASVAHA